MTDKREQYGYMLSYCDEYPKGVYTIHDRQDRPDYTKEETFLDRMAQLSHGKIVAVIPVTPEMDADPVYPPTAFRKEYERVIEYDRNAEGKPFVNLVEMIDDGDGGGFNQPCRFGNLCAGHAVYCHNEKWLYSPRKCRRTWYTGGKERDEDCEGFEPNPHYSPPSNSNQRSEP